MTGYWIIQGDKVVDCVYDPEPLPSTRKIAYNVADHLTRKTGNLHHIRPMEAV